ncbi:hypothetical protein [Siculibacillus lacustris]|uniref:hypothetical protein n=1 Tax=Siculibacillus lacustris TaxID=1549641 RepID=UPI0019D2EAC5|nr:hypothetical protein [Siculibacillus lacustris]
MIAEILTWLFTPATLDARRTGHLTAAVSLWSRARRCRSAWAPHEARCHAVVLRAFADLPRRRTCVVLGSGLVRDVPLAALSAAFERVLLVDVVHLWPARLAARRHRNVELVSLDITGTTDLLLGRATGLADPLRRFREDPTVDLVISANCLSQLPLQPVERVQAGGGLARIRFPDLGHRIVAGHLDALRRFSARVCLLTDSDGLDIAADGTVLERRPLLEGVTLPPADEDWDWILAPLGEWDPAYAVHHRAHGFADLHAAVARTDRGR